MAAGDLTTLENVGDFLNLSEAQYSADPNLPGFISAFSAFFLKLIGRPAILVADYSERRNGTGTRSLALYNSPITEVSSLTINGITVPASSDGLQPGYVADEYTLQLVHGTWETAPSPSAAGSGYPDRFYRGVGNVQIQYAAGYATAPLDVQQAITEMVAWAYKYKDRFGLNSQTTPQTFINAYSQQPLSPMAKLAVAKYRKKAAQWNG